jgi:hypothetical protein
MKNEQKVVFIASQVVEISTQTISKRSEHQTPSKIKLRKRNTQIANKA